MIVVGVDPDSVKHGVAVYDDRELKVLYTMVLYDLIEYLKGVEGQFIVSIEDANANKFIYSRNKKTNPRIQSNIAMAIGKCQQSQVELMRFLDELEMPYVLHRPQKGNWAKDEAKFKKATGWKGRSSEDTRSAAYFGFLAI